MILALRWWFELKTELQKNRISHTHTRAQRVLQAYLKKATATWTLEVKVAIMWKIFSSDFDFVLSFFLSIMGTSVLWLRASCSIYHSIFYSWTTTKKWTSTFCRCYYRFSFYRCDGFLFPLLLSIFFSFLWFGSVAFLKSQAH